MPRNFCSRVQINLIAVLVLLAAVGGAAVSNSAARPASSVHIVTYRVSIAASYSGQGPTKISCLHDVEQSDGTTLPQSYAINGSASENATLRTAKAAVLTVFIGGGNAGRYFQSDMQKAGRATVNVSRANVAPTEPCQRDPEGPPTTSTGCGSRSMSLLAQPETNPRGPGMAATVHLSMNLSSPVTFQLPDDPFQRKPSDLFPECLLPDGQAFFVGKFASDTCGTVTTAGDPTAHRFFSGAKRIVLAKTVHGYGFKTNDRGESLGFTRALCGTSSTYELKSAVTLVRTSGY